jgi:dipicolinate synthase subunit A
MNPDITVSVVGGDLRQGYLANMFAAEGFKTSACLMEKFDSLSPEVASVPPYQAAEASVLILPLPVTRDGTTVFAPFSYSPLYLYDFAGMLDPSTLVVGGKCPQELFSAISERGARLIDYLQREELSVMNAIPTAEGALAIAMNETRRTIYGSKCLVVGYGRIGQILARRLRSMGAEVTVSARKCADFAWIDANGYEGIRSDELSKHTGRFDIIFNTVPHLLLDEFALAPMKRDALIIDLASAPGGVDTEAASRYSIKVIAALSLPGRVAPVTAAEIIKNTILNIITEEFA